MHRTGTACCVPRLVIPCPGINPGYMHGSRTGQLGKLGQTSLSVLRANMMFVAGTVPVSMAIMPDMVVMNLSSNQLTGSLDPYAIEVQISRADLNTPLRALSLGGNTFSGVLTQYAWLNHHAWPAAEHRGGS